MKLLILVLLIICITLSNLHFILEHIPELIYASKYLSNYILFISHTHIYIFDPRTKSIIVTSEYELPLVNRGQNENSKRTITTISLNDNNNIVLFIYGNSFTLSKCILPTPTDTSMHTLSCDLIYSSNDIKVNDMDSYKVTSMIYNERLVYVISFIRTDNKIMLFIYEPESNRIYGESFVHSSSLQNNINLLNCVINNDDDKVTCFTINSVSIVTFSYKLKEQSDELYFELSKSENTLTNINSSYQVKKTSAINIDNESAICLLTSTKNVACINIKKMHHSDKDRKKDSMKDVLDDCNVKYEMDSFGSLIRNEDSFFVYCISHNKDKLKVNIVDFDFDVNSSSSFSFELPEDLTFITFLDFIDTVNYYLLPFCTGDSTCGIIGLNLITCFEDKMNANSFMINNNANKIVIDLYEYLLNQDHPINSSILNKLQIQINEIRDNNDNEIDDDDIGLVSSSDNDDDEFEYRNVYDFKSFRISLPIDASLISFPITITYVLSENEFNLSSKECTLSLSNCYHSCSSCTGTGTNDNHLCTSCINQYYFSPDITTNCINVQPPQTYLDKSTQSYKYCYSTCETCYGNGIDTSHNCKTCITSYAPLIDNNYNCYDITTTINGYYYSFTKGVFDNCDNACESCYNSKENGDTNCITCAEGYFPHLYNPTHCVPSCEPNYWYFDFTNREIKCTSTQQCPSTYPVLSIYSHNQCLDKCEDGKYYYNNECIPTCPLLTLIDNVKMKCYDEPEEFTIENIEEMIHAFNDGTVLYGDNFIVQIYNSSFLSTLKAFEIAIEKNLTFVDLNECVSVLKKVWSFNSTDDLIIMKVDLLQENTLTNQLDYLIFAPTEGNKLDMTVCSSLYVKANYPLLYNSNSNSNSDSNSNYNISINFDLAYNLSLLGHDVFDADDPLFNDFCMNFTSSDGTDVTIKDRRNDYFQNVSLCEHNCQYLQLLFNYNRVECACPIKQNITSDYINNGYDVMFEADPDHSNFEVAACYQLVFNKNIFLYNIGFYIFLFFSLIQLIVWIHYVFTGMKSVLRKINQVLKPGPPIRKKVSDTKVNKNNNNKNGLRITKDHPTHYDYFEHNNNNNMSKYGNGDIYTNTNYNESNIPTDDNLILSSSNSYKHQSKQNLFPVKKLSKKTNKYITTPTTSTRMNSIKTNQTFTYNNNNNPTSYSSRSNYPLSNNNNTNNNKNNCFIYKHSTKNENIPDKTISITPSSDIIKTNIIDYEEMEYRTALKKDKRSFLDIYWTYLKLKHIIFCLICDNDYVFKLIRFAVFILGYAIDCFFNALFFTDEHISKIYRIKNNLSFWDELPISILSYVVSAIFVYILEYLSSSKIKIKPKEGKTKTQFFKECNTLIKLIKCKLRFFFVIDLIFMCFFWYFVTAFCAVFQNSQINWVKNCLFSLMFTIIMPFLTCLLTAALRVKSISLKSKCMFKVTNFILLLT